MGWVYVIIIGVIVWWIISDQIQKNHHKSPSESSGGGIFETQNPIKPNNVSPTQIFPKESLDKNLLAMFRVRKEFGNIHLNLADDEQSSLYSILSSGPMQESKSNGSGFSFDALGNSVVDDVAQCQIYYYW